MVGPLLKDISSKAFIFSLIAFGFTFLIWFFTPPTSTAVHAIYQTVILIIAVVMLGERNPDNLDRIAGIFSLQLGFIMFLSSLNSGLNTIGGWADSWTWLFIPILAGGFIVTFLGGQNWRFLIEVFKRMLIPVFVFGVIGAVGGYFAITSLDFLGPMKPIIMALHNIFLFIFSSLWVWWSLSYASQQSKFARWLMFGSVAFFLVVGMHSLYLAGAFSGGDGEVQIDYTSLWANMYGLFIEGVQTGKEGIVKGAQNARNITVLNPTFDTRVERQQGQQIGVFFKVVPGQRNSFNNNENIFYRAKLEARTLDEPIVMKFDCTFDPRGKESKNITGFIQRDTVTVRTQLEQDFDCELDPVYAIDDLWPQGAHKLHLYSNFSFATSSYTKRYAMDIQNYEALAQQGVDPLDQFQISDKTPDSIFTPGPIKLSVGTTDYTLLAHSQNKNVSSLRIEILKNFGWDGDIVDFKQLVLFLPDGVTIKNDNRFEGNPLRCSGGVHFKQSSDVDICQNREYFGEGECNSLNTYVLDIEEFKKDYPDFSLSNNFGTSCPVEIASSRTLLSNAAFGILSFRAYADYDFQLHKEVPISIKKTAEETVQDDKACKFSGYGTATDTLAIDLSVVESAKTQLEGGEKAKMKALTPGMDENERALLYGIVKANGFNPDSEGRCIGVGGRCGIGQISSIQYQWLKNNQDSSLPDYTEYQNGKVSDNAHNLGLVKKYIDEQIKKNGCRDVGEVGQAECIVGQWNTGPGFSYPDYNSCTVQSICYYAIDTYIPTALSYATAYQIVENGGKCNPADTSS